MTYVHKRSIIVTWPLRRSRVGSDVFFNAFCAKSFPLTKQQALVNHPCKLVSLRLAAAKAKHRWNINLSAEQNESRDILLG